MIRALLVFSVFAHVTRAIGVAIIVIAHPHAAPMGAGIGTNDATSRCTDQAACHSATFSDIRNSRRISENSSGEPKP